MAARGTMVDAKYTYDPTKGDSKYIKDKSGKVLGRENTINPKTRKVLQSNITKMFSGVKFDNNGKANVGKATNKIYDKKGYVTI